MGKLSEKYQISRILTMSVLALLREVMAHVMQGKVDRDSRRSEDQNATIGQDQWVSMQRSELFVV
jgi:hypothetical protein